VRASHFSAEIGEELARRHRQTERREEKRRTRTRMPAAAGSSAAKAATSALTRVSAVSPALKKFLGVTEISRPETMKRIWSYIKDHNLQVGFRFISSHSLSLSRQPAQAHFWCAVKSSGQRLLLCFLYALIVEREPGSIRTAMKKEEMQASHKLFSHTRNRCQQRTGNGKGREQLKISAKRSEENRKFCTCLIMI